MEHGTIVAWKGKSSTVGLLVDLDMSQIYWQQGGRWTDRAGYDNCSCFWNVSTTIQYMEQLNLTPGKCGHVHCTVVELTGSWCLHVCVCMCVCVCVCVCVL